MYQKHLIDYRKQRDEIIKTITEKFDVFYSQNHDELNSLIKFINYSNSLITFLSEQAEYTYTVKSSLDTKYKAVERAIGYHAVIGIDNEIKARRWLINALVLIINDGWQYEAPFFTKDGVKKLHTKILQK